MKLPDAEQIAHVAAATWRDICVALSPIIGVRGVTALFNRSLSVTCVSHPELLAARDDVGLPGEFVALRTVLSQQSGSSAQAAQDMLLRNFVELLTNLIGGSLTSRLLSSVLNNPASGDAVEETSP